MRIIGYASMRVQRRFAGALIALGLCLAATLEPSVQAALDKSGRDVTTLAREKLVPVYSVQTQRKAVSVTLNAATGDEHIEQILDVLDDAGVTTSFFVLGSWAQKYPQAVKAIAAAGHRVENHSDRHPHMNALPDKEIAADIQAAGEKIEALTGAKPTLFRAPYGEYNDRVMTAANALGYTGVQWSIDSIDWKGEGQSVTVPRVLNSLAPGGIVLLHTDAKDVVPALRRILAGIKSAGYEAVPLDELLLTGPSRVDAQGVQRPLP